jgi:hypothetical protein
VLRDLDAHGLRNHVLVITRHQMKPADISALSQLVNIKLTLLFTYSGIDDKHVEPYSSHVAAGSLTLMSAPQSRQYRTILYWRPLVPALNDSDEHLDRAYGLSQHADATVFTGLFYRDQIAAYYRANGRPEPYEQTARRKAAEDRTRGAGTARAHGIRGFGQVVPQPPALCRTCRAPAGAAGRGVPRRAGSAARSSSVRSARRASRVPAFICRRSADVTSRSAGSGTARACP